MLCVRLVFSRGSLYCIVADPFFSLGVLMVFPLILIAIFWSGTDFPVFLSVIFTCMVMLSLVYMFCGSVILAIAWFCGIVTFLVTCLVL